MKTEGRKCGKREWGKGFTMGPVWSVPGKEFRGHSVGGFVTDTRRLSESGNPLHSV